MKKLRGGDDRAWAELHKQHSGAVFLYLQNNITGCREDAEDITSEAFMKAFQGITEFNGDCEIGTWLISIAKNAAKDYYKSPTNQPLGAEFHDTMLPRYMLNETQDDELMECVDDLPEIQRESITLHLDGYSCAEIAEKQGKTPEAVRKTRERAKRRIREDYFG